jgi:hypothetical protein
MTQTDALRSRRAVLATAVGAAAAAAAAATLGRPITATAASGDPLILGQLNNSSDVTEVNGPFIFNGGDGTSLGAWANTSTAVYGTSEKALGVLGESHGNDGRDSAGVRGWTDQPGGIGVVAENDFGGVGLQVSGKAQLLTRSGRAAIAAGRSYIDIDLRSNGGLAGTPLCFATLRSYRPGIYVAAVRANYPSSGKARIYLNKAITTTTNVSWFVLN